MTAYPKVARYVPGTHVRRTPDGADWAEQHLKHWLARPRPSLTTDGKDLFPKIICFSRKIGVGAQEIADLVSTRLALPVLDRAIVEHIAADADLREQTIAQFDERYPGLSNELMAFLFGEKSFVKNDYSRWLFKTVLALAGKASCILVGRGTHLILPRERVLAVRIICSPSYRIARVAELMDIPIEEAQKELFRFDKEQRAFFKKVFNCRDASPYEFDLVINRDQVPDPKWAAGIVTRAFAYKFGLPESEPNRKVMAEAS